MRNDTPRASPLTCQFDGHIKVDNDGIRNLSTLEGIIETCRVLTESKQFQIMILFTIVLGSVTVGIDTNYSSDYTLVLALSPCLPVIIRDYPCPLTSVTHLRAGCVVVSCEISACSK